MTCFGNINFIHPHIPKHVVFIGLQLTYLTCNSASSYIRVFIFSDVKLSKVITRNYIWEWGYWTAWKWNFSLNVHIFLPNKFKSWRSSRTAFFLFICPIFTFLISLLSLLSFLFIIENEQWLSNLWAWRASELKINRIYLIALLHLKIITFDFNTHFNLSWLNATQYWDLTIQLTLCCSGSHG